MALVDFEMKLQSKFICPQPLDASPLHKRVNQLPRVHDARAAHCVVDVVLGTRGVQVDRTNANFYQGHVPDAPVMLAPERGAAYADAAKKTGWGSLQRWAALGAVILTTWGASLLGMGVVWGASVLLNGLTASVPVLSAAGATVVGLLTCAVVGSALGYYEQKDWDNAQERFASLALLSQAYARGPHLGADARHLASDKAAMERALASDDWALQQAGLELAGLASMQTATAEPKAA